MHPGQSHPGRMRRPSVIASAIGKRNQRPLTIRGPATVGIVTSAYPPGLDKLDFGARCRGISRLRHGAGQD